MRSLLFILLTMIVAAGAGYAACRAAKWTPHIREMLVALTACTLAASVSMVPAMMARKAGPAVVSQSGLFGTVIHMFLAILLAAVGWMVKLATDRSSFLFGLLAFYWVSLVAVVLTLARIVRQAAAMQLAAVSPTARPASGPLPVARGSRT